MSNLTCEVEKSYDTVFADDVLDFTFINGKELGSARVDVNKYNKKISLPSEPLVGGDDDELEVKANVLLNEKIPEFLDYEVDEFSVFHAPNLDKKRKEYLRDMLYSQSYFLKIAGLFLPPEMSRSFRNYSNRIKSHAEIKGYL